MKAHSFAAILFLMTALLVEGCQLPTAPPPPSPEPTAALAWPQPPLQPRIRFIKTVANPRDIEIHPSFMERLGEIILGKEEAWFIRPTDVAASGSIIYVADPGAQAIWILNPSANLFRRLSKVGEEQLISPVALAVGSSNSVYLADSYLAKVFILDAEGNLTGTIARPEFRRPAGLAYDTVRDRLYVADSAAHRVWIFSGNGRRLGAIGRRGTGNGEFNFPTHVAVDRRGFVYVTDSLGFQIQIFSPDGAFERKFGKHGDAAGDFARPKGIALDSEGHTYVVEALFDAVQIFDQQGSYLLTFGERGLGPGQFWLPGGIFIDPQDRIYVADSYNQRIQIFQYLVGGGP